MFEPKPVVGPQSTQSPLNSGHGYGFSALQRQPSLGVKANVGNASAESLVQANQLAQKDYLEGVGRLKKAGIPGSTALSVANNFGKFKDVGKNLITTARSSATPTNFKKILTGTGGDALSGGFLPGIASGEGGFSTTGAVTGATLGATSRTQGLGRHLKPTVSAARGAALGGFAGHGANQTLGESVTGLSNENAARLGMGLGAAPSLRNNIAPVKRYLGGNSAVVNKGFDIAEQAAAGRFGALNPFNVATGAGVASELGRAGVNLAEQGTDYLANRAADTTAARFGTTPEELGATLSEAKGTLSKAKEMVDNPASLIANNKEQIAKELFGVSAAELKDGAQQMASMKNFGGLLAMADPLFSGLGMDPAKIGSMEKIMMLLGGLGLLGGVASGNNMLSAIGGGLALGGLGGYGLSQSAGSPGAAPAAPAGGAAQAARATASPADQPPFNPLPFAPNPPPSVIQNQAQPVRNELNAATG